MKKLFMLLLVAFAALCCVSCSDDDDDKNKDFPTEDPNDPNIVRTITLTVNTWKYVKFELDNEEWCDSDHPEISVGRCPFPKDLIIDWGDGSVTSSNTHEYAISGKYNIVISAKDLKWFSSDYNGITAIDVKGCNSLVGIQLRSEDINSLDVAGFTELKYLYLYNNHLDTLNANGSEKLIVLNCRANDLTSLDVSGCTALADLDCSANDLTSLDVSKCTKLTELDCSRNNLTSAALNQIFRDLPQVTYGQVHIYDNPGTETCDTSIAENKDWEVD